LSTQSATRRITRSRPGRVVPDDVPPAVEPVGRVGGDGRRDSTRPPLIAGPAPADGDTVTVRVGRERGQRPDSANPFAPVASGGHA